MRSTYTRRRGKVRFAYNGCCVTLTPGCRAHGSKVEVGGGQGESGEAEAVQTIQTVLKYGVYLPMQFSLFYDSMSSRVMTKCLYNV